MNAKLLEVRPECFVNPDTKWKYLRESNKKYYVEGRNTPLCDYLDAIFPGELFIYDTTLSKDLIERRNPDAEYHRYRPDARCERLNLIIEFDGVNHYQDSQIVIDDYNKNKYYEDVLHYKVVHIPYWIQLSKEAILYYFDVDMDKDMCKLAFSFYSPERDDCGLSISTGSMCEAGRIRFINEFNSLPNCLKYDVMVDLLTCCYTCPSSMPIEYILPKSVRDRLDISFLEYTDKFKVADDRDIHVFQECYNEFNYIDKGIRQFSGISFDKIKKFIDLGWIRFNNDKELSVFNDYSEFVQIHGAHRWRFMGVCTSMFFSDGRMIPDGIELFDSITDSELADLKRIKDSHPEAIWEIEDDHSYMCF